MGEYDRTALGYIKHMERVTERAIKEYFIDTCIF